MNLWNASEIKDMVLPPCHMVYKFSVENGKLSYDLIQRSWDILLGWNTSTAALLTYLLAAYCGLEVGHLTHTSLNTHIYKNQISSFEQFKYNLPHTLPKLKMVNVPDKIEDFKFEDVVLENYKFHGNVKIQFSA